MSRYRATMKDLLEKVYKEDGHQDVSSSKRMCKTIVEDAQQIETKLNSMSPEDSLDTWWTNKLAVSANNLNKARDYIVNDVKEELQKAKTPQEKIKTMVKMDKIKAQAKKSFDTEKNNKYGDWQTLINFDQNYKHNFDKLILSPRESKFGNFRFLKHKT